MEKVEQVNKEKEELMNKHKEEKKKMKMMMEKDHEKEREEKKNFLRKKNDIKETLKTERIKRERYERS